MITPDLTHCKTLAEFHLEVRTAQEKAHGPGYTAMHNAISKIVKNLKSPSYVEFGVMQGSTAACAILAGASELLLVDINFSRFDPYFHLFEAYDKGRVRTKNISSTDPKLKIKCDVLLIDSVHKSDHLSRELNLHASNVNKYIICHDTFKINSLHVVIEKYCKAHPEWIIDEYHKVNVGYTVMKRISNE